MARRHGRRVDAVPHRPAALHQVDQDMVAVLAGRNLRFHEYDLVPPTNRIDDLLAEIDRDPTSIFWG